jgi:hypothetical protein
MRLHELHRIGRPKSMAGGWRTGDVTCNPAMQRAQRQQHQLARPLSRRNFSPSAVIVTAMPFS